MSRIVEMPGYELSAHIHRKQVSCMEVMDAYLDQIERLNPAVNAIVALEDREKLALQAKEKDARLAAGQSDGWMHGFPQAVKDLEPTAGLRSTSGSPILGDFIPAEDGLIAARMKAAGAIVIGKTNVPEWGYGSQSHNLVYGATGNPYDPTLTCGGSSGAGACAVALRMQAVADGSDRLGSLRSAAGFCNVFGLRPSIGRVPIPGDAIFYNTFATQGPLARSISDLALLLATQSGYSRTAPLSREDDTRLKALTPENVHESLAVDPKGVRIGWLGDLCGYLPMEDGVLETCERVLDAMVSMGAGVESIKPFFDPLELWERILIPVRQFGALTLKKYYDNPETKALLKPEIIYEIEGGLKLSACDIHAAFVRRAHFYSAMMKVYESYDLLAIPSAQIFPFCKDIPWPQEIEGVRMTSYHRWMEIASPWALGGNAVVSIPSGFGGERQMPMGVQLIAKPHHDFELLQFAYAFERATEHLNRHRPKVADV